MKVKFIHKPTGKETTIDCDRVINCQDCYMVTNVIINGEFMNIELDKREFTKVKRTVKGKDAQL